MKDDQKPFVEHLEELRWRLGFTLLAVLILSVASYFLVDSILAILSKSAGKLVFIRPVEALVIRLKISLISGIFLSVPIVIYEVWRFVGVALTSAEKKATFFVLPVSFALFCAGAAIALFGVLPVAIKFLLGFATTELQPMLSVSAYVEFIAWFTLAFGVMFQLPLVVIFLVKIGLVTPEHLSQYRRYVVLALAVIAAIATPGPDLFSQMALFIPTYLLYEISVLIARWVR